MLKKGCCILLWQQNRPCTWPSSRHSFFINAFEEVGWAVSWSSVFPLKACSALHLLLYSRFLLSVMKVTFMAIKAPGYCVHLRTGKAQGENSAFRYCRVSSWWLIRSEYLSQSAPTGPWTHRKYHMLSWIRDESTGHGIVLWEQLSVSFSHFQTCLSSYIPCAILVCVYVCL